MRWLLPVVAFCMLLSSGYSDMVYGDGCFDANVVMHNTSTVTSESSLNTTTFESCDYGCDTTYGRCKTIDSGYGGMVIAGFIFTIIVMLLLFQITRPKDEDEYDIPKVGFSMVFLIIGLIALGNLLLFIGSLGSGLTSAFISDSSGMMLSMGDMIQLIVWAFAVMIVIVFIFRIFENRSRARNDQRRGE